MNKLNNLPEVKAVNAGAVFAANGYVDGSPRAPDKDLEAVIGGLRMSITTRFAGLFDPDRGRAAANFLHSLRGRFDWHGSPAKRCVTAVKYIIRSLCMPRQHGQYLELVYGNPCMRAYRRRDPRMLERHLHRYINTHWNRQARLLSIQRHYRFALNRLPTALIEAIYVAGDAPVGILSLKDGSQLKLGLRPPISMGCEGELTIQLSDTSDRPLYRIILTVMDNRPTIAIGCIQGSGGEDSKDLIRGLTRNMHGMRPKQLMLSLVYAFAQHFGIKRIWAVSNAAHPLRRARRQFQADYDSFWLEQGGNKIGSGWFILPERPSRKSEAAVPSKHRAEFRRREALRMEAERLLTYALGAIPPGMATSSTRHEQASAQSPQWECWKVSWTS